MSLHLPRPYPDELVGSMLQRAERQLGIGRGNLAMRLTGHNLASCSLLTTLHEGVAHAFGYSMTEFHRKHTMQSYMTAFKSVEQKTYRAAEPPTAKPLHVPPHSRYIKLGQPWLKLCPHCVENDLSRYGESYWHRVHQLCAVDFCVHHQAQLRISPQLIQRQGTLLFPHEVASTTNSKEPGISMELRYAISQASSKALWSEGRPQDWVQVYKQRAQALGYIHRQHSIERLRLAQDMECFFGDSFLKKYGCEIHPQRKEMWLRKMFSYSAPVATTFKHILINVFLDSQMQGHQFK